MVSDRPRIAEIGVFSSWDAFATKSLRTFSRCSRSVMSSRTKIPPVSSPNPASSHKYKQSRVRSPTVTVEATLICSDMQVDTDCLNSSAMETSLKFLSTS